MLLPLSLISILDITLHVNNNTSALEREEIKDDH